MTERRSWTTLELFPTDPFIPWHLTEGEDDPDDPFGLNFMDVGACALHMEWQEPWEYVHVIHFDPPLRLETVAPSATLTGNPTGKEPQQ